ncbi:uncharacterized protein BKCO1_6400033 [Diplodia corticola]|uniref:Uncharacterized protein n=1 Tax=Diplodia corticola TaxID=236234 RepID=A0A1J9RCL3_9PEZI|nr:uncharacterized protein BKCO1_6400033 [Diplodia corticola]OJD30219.1 hypothetical protein BKCO1_6400033 [Diplodia corticola]
MAPPTTPPASSKAKLTSSALHQQSDLLSPSMGMTKASDQDVHMFDDSPAHKRKSSSSHPDEHLHHRKRPSRGHTTYNQNKPVITEKDPSPKNVGPQYSKLGLPNITPQTSQDMTSASSQQDTFDGSFDSKLTSKKRSSKGAQKKQRQKLNKKAKAAQQPPPTTPPPAPPGPADSEVLSLQEFLDSFPAPRAANKNPPPPPTKPKKTVTFAPTTTTKPAKPVFGPPLLPSSTPADDDALSDADTAAETPHTLPSALALLSLPHGTPSFTCAKCRIQRPTRLLSLSREHLTAQLVSEGCAPLCTYCAEQAGMGTNDAGEQVRWCEKGGHEGLREWHWGWVGGEDGGGEWVEGVDCLRGGGEAGMGHAAEGGQEVQGPLGGWGTGVWEGWRAWRWSSGVWVVEGDGGRGVRREREERRGG